MFSAPQEASSGSRDAALAIQQRKVSAADTSVQLGPVEATAPSRHHSAPCRLTPLQHSPAVLISVGSEVTLPVT